MCGMLREADRRITLLLQSRGEGTEAGSGELFLCCYWKCDFRQTRLYL